MSNEHPPRIPYVPREDELSSWQDVVIKSGRRNLRNELLSTTSPLDVQKSVEDSYDQFNATEYQGETILEFNPYEDGASEQIENYLAKVKDALLEWEAAGGLKRGDDAEREAYNELFKIIKKLEKDTNAQHKALLSFKNAETEAKEACAQKLEERILEVISGLKKVSELYEPFLEIEDIDSPEEFSGEETSEAVLKENELLKQYLLYKGSSEGQIEEMLKKDAGRKRLLGFALEWQLRDESSPFGRLFGKIERASDYILSVKEYVPEEMKDRYEKLENYFDTVVKPALYEQERFLKGEAGTVDEWGALEEATRTLLDDTSGFSDDLMRLQHGVSEDASVDSPVEEDLNVVVTKQSPTTVMTGREPLPGKKKPRIYIDPNFQNQLPVRDNDTFLSEQIEAYEYQADEVQAAFQTIFNKRNLENFSDTDKLDFNFFHENFVRLKEVISKAKVEVETDGDISLDTKQEFDALYNQLQKGVSHYEDLIAKGDNRFKVEESEPVQDIAEATIVTAGGQPDSAVEDPVTTGEDESTLQPEGYDKLRQDWKEAGRAHLEAHQAYRDASATYFEGLQNQGFWAKNFTRLKTSFGIKPELPAEVASMREEMFAKTEAYNALARKMVEERMKDGQVEDAVLKRYRGMLTRTLLLNTFDEQRKQQLDAAEQLGFKPGKYTEFFSKHKKSLRVAGAVAVGALSGAVIPAGIWWVRSTVGAAAAGVATKYVGEKMDTFVDNTKKLVESNFGYRVNELEARLADGTKLNSEELEEVFTELQKLNQMADGADRLRIQVLL